MPINIALKEGIPFFKQIYQIHHCLTIPLIIQITVSVTAVA